jgi:zinc transport system ATP-binding protein
MALIECKDAAFGYEGRNAVWGLCFTVSPGDYLCVAGENGSGKSTLLRGILRLLPPLAGSVLFGDGLKQTSIGYTGQVRAGQKDFPASVYEVILSGRQAARGLRPFYTRADKEAAAENARLLGVRDLYPVCYRELSGGQQQRVLLARALCAAEKLLVLDEPAAGLDPIVVQDMYRVVETANKAGMTVIMVSHDIPGAVKYARTILHLDKKQVFFGPVAEYTASEVYARFVCMNPAHTTRGGHGD